MKGSQLFERERSLRPPPLPSSVILNLPKKKVQPLASREANERVVNSLADSSDCKKTNVLQKNVENNPNHRPKAMTMVLTTTSTRANAASLEKENFNPVSSSSSSSSAPLGKIVSITKEKEVARKDSAIEESMVENDKSPERTTPNTSSIKAKENASECESERDIDHLDYNEESKCTNTIEKEVVTVEEQNFDTTAPSSSSINDSQASKKADFRTLDFFDSSVGNLPLILSDSSDKNHCFEIHETMKILIVGNAKCGKSSIIARYAMNSFHENYKTTIGADFVRKDLSLQMQDGEQLGVRLQLWDIAGFYTYTC